MSLYKWHADRMAVLVISTDDSAGEPVDRAKPFFFPDQERAAVWLRRQVSRPIADEEIEEFFAGSGIGGRPPFTDPQ